MPSIGREAAHRPSPISEEVHKCLESFDGLKRNALSPTAEDVGEISTSKVSNAADRFRLWVGNIGAHRKDRGSLDFRLKDAPLIQSNVLDILSALSSRMEEASAILQGRRVPFEKLPNPDPDDDSGQRLESDSDADSDSDSNNSESSSEETELGQLMDGIEERTSMLLRISMVIRNPAPRDHSAYSNQAFTSHFDPYDKGRIQDKFKKAHSQLVERLASALSARRKFLKYRKERHNELSAGLEILDPDGNGQNPPPSIVATSIPAHMKDMAGWDLGMDTSSESGVSATSFAPSFQEEDSSETRRLRKTPLMPEEGRHGRPFECPICFGIISVNEGSWKKHVSQDLAPYICTFESCITPFQRFERCRDWFEHEVSHRSKWRCPKDCGRKFNTRQDLFKHLSTHPELEFYPELPPELTRACQEKPDYSSLVDCPLCGENLRLLQLQSHLGKHQYQLALYILRDHLEDTSILYHDESEVSDDNSVDEPNSRNLEHEEENSTSGDLKEEGNPLLSMDLNHPMEQVQVQEQQALPEGLTATGSISIPSDEAEKSRDLENKEGFEMRANDGASQESQEQHVEAHQQGTDEHTLDQEGNRQGERPREGHVQQSAQELHQERPENQADDPLGNLGQISLEADAPKPEEKRLPIKFKDAVGRKFSFPWHLCKTWRGMEGLIKQAFLHVDVIGQHVHDGHYDLVGPDGEIILPQVWETVVQPDWTVTMHMWPMEEPPFPGRPMPPSLPISTEHDWVQLGMPPPQGGGATTTEGDSRRRTFPPKEPTEAHFEPNPTVSEDPDAAREQFAPGKDEKEEEMVSSLDPSEELLRRSQQVVEPETTSELNRQRSNLGSGLADTLRHSPATEVGTSHARTVSPSEPDEDIEKPKGILRKPTEKFPEDPNPIREGVAPMKDSIKSKDVPPDARWTKIDRQLVCPEALTEAKERFEERLGCVIVLRVLTKDEIQALADRTREILESSGNRQPSTKTVGDRRQTQMTQTNNDNRSSRLVESSSRMGPENEVKDETFSQHTRGGDQSDGQELSPPGNQFPSNEERPRKGPLTEEQIKIAAELPKVGACQNCRRRKFKCDLGTPCQSCVKHLGPELVNFPCRNWVPSGNLRPDSLLQNEIPQEMRSYSFEQGQVNLRQFWPQFPNSLSPAPPPLPGMSHKDEEQAEMARAAGEALEFKMERVAEEGGRQHRLFNSMDVPVRTPHYDRSTSPSSSVYAMGDDSKSTHVTTPVASTRSSSQEGHTSHGYSHRKVWSIDNGEAVPVDPKEVDSRQRDGSREAFQATTQRFPVTGLNESEYSYTDPASMYEETEPTWRGRSNSVDLKHPQPISMLGLWIPKTSTGDLSSSPVPTQEFDKLDGSAATGAIGRTSSLRRHQ